MKEDDEDKPEGATQAQLEQQIDPEQAVFAEQAIFAYANWVLDQFREQLVAAVDAFGAWALSANEDHALDSAAFMNGLATVAEGQLVALFGGRDTPVGAHLVGLVEGPIDQAARQEEEVAFFVAEVSRAARDACWYLRDNVQAILSNQWDRLRDLAYEGSTEFIPVLHQLGFPRAELNAADLQATLQAEADRYKASLPRNKEEATKDVQAEQDPAAEQDAEQDKQAFQAEAEPQKQAS